MILLWFTNHYTNIWFVAKDRFDFVLDTLGHDFDLRSFANEFDLISNQKMLTCHSFDKKLATMNWYQEQLEY